VCIPDRYRPCSRVGVRIERLETGMATGPQTPARNRPPSLPTRRRPPPQDVSDAGLVTQWTPTSRFCASRRRTSRKFTDFCDWIGFKLYPGQRVLCKVAFDGVDPIDLQPEERAIARKLFGPIDRIPPDVRRTVVIVIGARGGKTRISATRVLHLALTIPAPFLAPGEKLYSVQSEVR